MSESEFTPAHAIREACRVDKQAAVTLVRNVIQEQLTQMLAKRIPHITVEVSKNTPPSEEILKELHEQGYVVKVFESPSQLGRGSDNLTISINVDGI